MRFAIMAAAMLAVAPGSAVAATADDFQIWAVLNLSTDLSPKIVGNLELAGRFPDDASRLGVAIIRPTIGYKVSKNLVLHIGYAHQTTFNRGAPNVDENRFFQQTNWRVGKIGTVTVNSRTRIELRTVEGARDSGWRIRQRVQLQIPMKAKGTNLLLSTEQFFALNSTDWGARAGFDQMRNFIGVSFPVGKALTLETGFQHRYQRRVGNPDRSDFVVPVTLSVKL
jgi:Protein of unknown function (DUF2490)